MFKKRLIKDQIRLEAIEKKLQDNGIKWIGMEFIVDSKMKYSKKAKVFSCLVIPKNIEENISHKIIRRASDITEENFNQGLWLLHPANYEEAKKFIDEQREENAKYLKDRLIIDNFEYYIILTDKNGKDFYII